MEKIVQMCVKFNDETMRKRINLNKLTRLFFPPDEVQRIISRLEEFFMTSLGICLLMNNFRLHLLKINEKSGIGFDVIKISFERVVGEVKPLKWITKELVLGKVSVSVSVVWQ